MDGLAEQSPRFFARKTLDIVRHIIDGKILWRQGEQKAMRLDMTWDMYGLFFTIGKICLLKLLHRRKSGLCIRLLKRGNYKKPP